MKMCNRNIFGVMPALVLGLVLAGCPQGIVDEEGDENSQKVSSLSSFEGEFVANEEDAKTLVSGADWQIQQAIGAALAQGLPENSVAARVVAAESGHYDYNGIILDYTVTGDISGGTFPSEGYVKELVSINGTYGGYKIQGKYQANLHYTIASETEYRVRYEYDCGYTVSYGGKGMKVITTGEMSMTSWGSQKYNLHYAVYDNNNVLQYNCATIGEVEA
jgi:hypothetical protein